MVISRSARALEIYSRFNVHGVITGEEEIFISTYWPIIYKRSRAREFRPAYLLVVDGQQKIFPVGGQLVIETQYQHLKIDEKKRILIIRLTSKFRMFATILYLKFSIRLKEIGDVIESRER